MSILFYDTCSLLDAQKEAFETGEKFLVSSITINELENIKSSGSKDEEIKYNARTLLHLLEAHEDKYDIVLYKTSYMDRVADFDLPNTPDSKIIASAYCYFLDNKVDGIFYTKDLACKAIAKSIGLQTSYKVTKEVEYTGFIERTSADSELNEIYSIYIPNNINAFELLNNQYLLIKDTTGKIIDKYRWYNGEYHQVQFQKAESRMFGKVVPKNGDHYQQIALDSLAHNQITMLRGAAGSGKSYLAFGHMFSLLEQGKIDKIIIFCNTVATKGSAKLGFYPGSRTEKLLDSQIGNLLESKLGDRIAVERLIDDGQLVLLPMSDIRGYDTTGMNAAIYISEAQNLDIELMRLALQRIGDDSICILDGDSNAQVDLSMYAGDNNGMRRVSKVFRGADFYGEVTLVNIHRSKIAKLAQDL